MSIQSEHKKLQGYIEKPVLQICQNCANFTSKQIRIEWHPTATKEGELRCRIGGFSIKKMGTCNEFIGRHNIE